MSPASLPVWAVEPNGKRDRHVPERRILHHRPELRRRPRACRENSGGARLEEGPALIAVANRSRNGLMLAPDCQRIANAGSIAFHPTETISAADADGSFGA
jgi:hypothetical protein